MATAQQEIYDLIISDVNDKDVRQQLVTIERLWFYFKGINQISGGSGGGVASVTGNIVDNTDPANPVVTQVQSDWTEADNSLPSFILNKPAIGTGTFDQYIDGTGALRNLLVTDTLTNIQDLATNSLLVPGAFYRITDAASNWEVVLPAISFTELGTVGLGIYVSGNLYADIQYNFISGILLKVSESKYNNTVEYNGTLAWDNISAFAWNSSNVTGNTIDGTSKFNPGASGIASFNYNTVINNSEFTITTSDLQYCNNNTIDNSSVILTNIGLTNVADFKENRVINSYFSINTVDFININNNHIDYYNLQLTNVVSSDNFIDNKFIGYYDLNNTPSKIIGLFNACSMSIINNKFINTSFSFTSVSGWNWPLCEFKNNIFENNTKTNNLSPSIIFIGSNNGVLIDYFENNKFYNTLGIYVDDVQGVNEFSDNICENSFIYISGYITYLNNNSWKNCFDFEFITNNIFNSFSHNTFLETSAWVESVGNNHDFTYNNMQYVRDSTSPLDAFLLKVYEDQNYKYCINGVGSTFTATLDFADSTIWNGSNQISFNSYGWQNWVGVYTITGASGTENVTNFYKGPIDFPFYIWGQPSTTISLLNTGNVIMNNTVGGVSYWYSAYDYMKFNSYNDRFSGNFFMTETFNY